MSSTLEEAQKRAWYFGGHDFGYESVSDLFKCCYCGMYEVVARKDATEDAPIKPCPGLTEWGDEKDRVYFQARRPGTTDMSGFMEVDDQVHYLVRDTGVARCIPYSRRLDASTTTVYETTPSHLDGVLDKRRGLPNIEIDQLTINDVDRIVAAFVDDYNARNGERRGYIADVRAK